MHLPFEAPIRDFIKKGKLQQSGSARGGEVRRTDEDSKCLKAEEEEELWQMLPAVARCVGVTSAHPYRAEQTHKLSHCAVALVLSFSILDYISPQASLCPVLIVFIRHCWLWPLCSVLWPLLLCWMAVSQL